jgi:gamma-glutamyltranspeptidase/glutathione hydrolase
MAPSLVLRDRSPPRGGERRLLRLRGAIFQIVINDVARGMAVEEAIDRPRVHLDGNDVHCEGGNDPNELARLEEWGYQLVRWRRRNLYFGGAAGVEFREDGLLAAAGDARRGGHGVVIE